MYQKTTLNNGIRVVTERIPQVQSISIGCWFKTGSRDENKVEEHGIAHFIEHMLFKGTEKRTALEIAREIDSVGGILNAATSRELTNFYAKILEKDFDLAIELLADILLNSVLPPKEIERERGVISQEIRMVEDTPDEYIQDLFNQHFFPGNSLGHPILGDHRTIGHITKTQLQKFFQTYYLSPSRIIVSAAGKLNHDVVVDKINSTLGRIKPKVEHRTLDTPQPASTAHIVHKELEQVHLCMGTKGISQTHPLRFSGYLLNLLLGGSMSSRLFQEIREKRGLAYAVFSYLSSYSDTGLFTIYAGTTHKKVKKVIDLILTELRRFKEEPLQKEEVEKAKDQLKGNILLSYESTDNRMSRLAKGELYFSRFIPLKEILQGIKKVSAEDIQGLARELFQKDTFSLVALGKVKENEIASDLLTL